MDDALFFELPTLEVLAAFRDRLRPAWDSWADADADVWLFAVRLHADGDLAALLHDVQELLAEIGIVAIRFCLDGRLYTLAAATAAEGTAALSAHDARLP